MNLRVSTAVALYILNHKRAYLQFLLEQRGLNVVIQIDDSLAQGEHSLERTETNEDFVAPASHIDLADLDDGFDDSAYDDEDEDVHDEEDFVSSDEDEDAEDRAEEGVEDEEAESHETEGRNGRRRRRRRGGREDDGEEVAAAHEEDEDDSRGGRRRRGRRGGRRMREEGERDVYAWVRGRTPSLQDPYVWFDPINPIASRPERAVERVQDQTAQDVSLDQVAAPEEGRGSRSRRRRGRGRGRGQGELTHEAKVEDRAVNEGLPPVGSPDTPIAVMIDEGVAEAASASAGEAAPVLEPVEAPKRRRVRRKVTSAIAEELTEVAAEQVDESPATEAEAPVVAEAEAEPKPVPAELDVTPAVAARIEQAIEEVLVEEAVVLAEPVPAPTPEVDIDAIIAEDPNQIVAPPEKPKRGWWRR
ncbi:Ribonuclease E [compost metagenome]